MLSKTRVHRLRAEVRRTEERLEMTVLLVSHYRERRCERWYERRCESQCESQFESQFGSQCESHLESPFESPFESRYESRCVSHRVSRVLHEEARLRRVDQETLSQHDRQFRISIHHAVRVPRKQSPKFQNLLSQFYHLITLRKSEQNSMQRYSHMAVPFHPMLTNSNRSNVCKPTVLFSRQSTSRLPKLPVVHFTN